jgi:hypothetical protein
VRGGKR